MADYDILCGIYVSISDYVLFLLNHIYELSIELSRDISFTWVTGLYPIMNYHAKPYPKVALMTHEKPHRPDSGDRVLYTL